MKLLRRIWSAYVKAVGLCPSCYSVLEKNFLNIRSCPKCNHP